MKTLMQGLGLRKTRGSGRRTRYKHRLGRMPAPMCAHAAP